MLSPATNRYLTSIFGRRNMFPCRLNSPLFLSLILRKLQKMSAIALSLLVLY